MTKQAGKQRPPCLRAAPLLAMWVGACPWLFSLLTPGLPGSSGDLPPPREDGALHFLRRSVDGNASPLLMQDAFPGKYMQCPYWKSKHRDKIISLGPALAHWDALFKNGDRFHDLTAGKSCAIVGSSGILRSGGFGAEISAHDTVVRFGLASIADASLAGNRTDILWLNPSAADKLAAGALAAHRTQLVVVAALLASNYPRVSALARRAADAGLDVAVGPLDCGFFRDVRAAAAGVTTRVPTSGLLTVAWALRFCASVDLYGVWPYATDCGGKNKVPYHYFDSLSPSEKSTTHDFEAELRGYRALERDAAAQGVAFRLRLPETAQCESV